MVDKTKVRKCNAIQISSYYSQDNVIQEIKGMDKKTTQFLHAKQLQHHTMQSVWFRLVLNTYKVILFSYFYQDKIAMLWNYDSTKTKVS